MKKILTIVFLISIISCTQEVPLVNEFQSNIGILSSSNDLPSRISLLERSTGDILIEDIISSNNDSGLSSVVKSIVGFDQEIYLVLPDEQKILCISRLNFNIITEYDFSSQNLTPIDICFPNASNGYVIFENSTELVLIDRINKGISNVRIELNFIPSDINYAGNRIYVISEIANKILFIGTNTKQVGGELDTWFSPIKVDVDPSGDEIFVMCSGYNSISDTKEIAKGMFISTSNEVLIDEIDLADDFSRDNDIIPYDFTYTNEELDFIFLTTDKGLLRIDTRNKSNIRFVSNVSHSQIFFNDLSSELIMLQVSENRKDLILSNAETGIVNYSFFLPTNTGLIFPNN